MNKRPPGLWLLLSAGVLWLSVQNVHGVKATSLIFGKSTTTTTTSAPEAAEEAAEQSTEVAADTNSNSTKPVLTGIPQIDYIWDPNLPQELNGYNLTEYPFYDRVPKEIDFKCDGLHDGFYASVPHKCQVYHHCLYGTRYDFLCANYTAFDQKTFICHFVSEVDCVNSKKFWHRNDALYQAASTTTVKPLVVYTSPPPPAVAPAAQPAAVVPRRPAGGRRRPFRRRPQYDYYEYEDEDYYEEARSRKRPRPRPRPLYEDDYEEYEDERVDRRRPSRRRPYYDRRGYEDRRPNRRRNKYDEDEEYEYDTPRYHRRDEQRNKNKKEGKPPVADEDYDRPKKPQNKRPVEDTYYDDEPVAEEKRNNKRPDESEKKPPKATEDKMLIKPVSGSSVYDRPRAPPPIRPPVPKHEQGKFAYKPVAAQPEAKVPEDEEYYDDYEDEVTTKPVVKTTRRPEESKRPLKHTAAEREEGAEMRQTTSQSRPRGYSPRRPEEEDEEEIRPNFRRPHKRPRPKYGPNRYGRLGHKPDEYEDEYEEITDSKDPPEEVEHREPEVATKPPTTTTTAKDVKERPEQVVRIVKRPFLPSRGGNPYVPRGLKPVGVKVAEEEAEEEPKSDADDHEHLTKVELTQKEPPPNEEDAPKTTPKVIESPKPSEKPPPKTEDVQYEDEEEEDLKPITHKSPTKYKQVYRLEEIEPPKVTEKSPKTPLDTLNESEYDVTLNDALNPTLPNLPVRAFPTGFSSGSEYRSLQRPRLAQESTDVSYQVKLPPPMSAYSNRQVVTRNADYSGQYSTLSGQVSGLFRPKNRVTQAQTHGFYSSYK